MPEIILHVYDKDTGQELSVAEVNEPNVRVFSFKTDKFILASDFAPTDTTSATRVGKTLGQDFIDRIVGIKARAIAEQQCSKNYCHWCKDCYNKVCDALGKSMDKIP